MENVTSLPANSTVYSFRTRKEANKVLRTLEGDWTVTNGGVAGEWTVLPSLYWEYVTGNGDTLPDNLPDLLAGLEEFGALVEAPTPEEVEEDTDGTTEEVDLTEDGDPVEVEEEDGEEVEDKALRMARLRTELDNLRARVRELEGELAGEKVHILVTSTVKGPVALVRDIFLSMVTEDGEPGVRRDVVNTAIRGGVAPNTAKTQYQVLSRKLRDGDGDLLEELDNLRSTLSVGE